MTVRKYRQNRKTAGFTLLELAISMAISGIIFLMLVTLYKGYRNIEVQDLMEKRLELAKISLSSFVAGQSIAGGKRYPCPAYPDVPLSDDEAGWEQCEAFADLNFGECSPRGICKIEGREVDGASSEILVGAFPYRTVKTGMASNVCYDITSGKIGDQSAIVDCTDPNAYNPNEAGLSSVNMREILDPWYFQMTYVVTGGLTNPATYDAGIGGIDVQTEDGVPLVDPAGSAEYILLYHGDNHMGAYNAFGNIEVPCTNTSADFSNCEALLPGGDNLFIVGLRSMGDGSEYFDDAVKQWAPEISRLWEPASMGSADIYNNNPGNIGIGVNDPAEKLDIDGSLRSTNAVKTPRVCDAAGENCFAPSLLGGGAGTAIGCPDGEVMQAIVDGWARCAPMEIVPLSADIECPLGEYIRGFRSDGEPICEPPY